MRCDSCRWHESRKQGNSRGIGPQNSRPKRESDEIVPLENIDFLVRPSAFGAYGDEGSRRSIARRTRLRILPCIGVGEHTTGLATELLFETADLQIASKILFNLDFGQSRCARLHQSVQQEGPIDLFFEKLSPPEGLFDLLGSNKDNTADPHLDELRQQSLHGPRTGRGNNEVHPRFNRLDRVCAAHSDAPASQPRLRIRRLRLNRFDYGRTDWTIHDSRLENLANLSVKDIEYMFRAHPFKCGVSVIDFSSLEEDAVHFFGVTHETLLSVSSRISFATASTSAAVTASIPFTTSCGSRTSP